jgi:hypothetical protein
VIEPVFLSSLFVGKKLAAVVPLLVGAVTIEWETIRKNWTIILFIGAAIVAFSVAAHRLQAVSDYIDGEPDAHSKILESAVGESARLSNLAISELRQEINKQLITIAHDLEMANIVLKHLSIQDDKGGRFTSADGDDLKVVDTAMEKRIRILEDGLHGKSRFEEKGNELEIRIRQLESRVIPAWGYQ